MRLNTVDNKDRNFQNPKGYQLNYLLKLIFMPHLFWAIGALGFLLITVLITLSLPIMVRYIVDGYTFNFETGQKYLFIGCALVAVAAFGTAVRFYLVTLLGERLVSDLRQELFDKIIMVENTKQKKPAIDTVVNFGVSFLHLRVTEKT